MPRRDGTGPMKMGAMTGRGMGFCNVVKDLDTIGGLGLGLGLRCRRGFGGNGLRNMNNPENQKSLLMEQKSILEKRLNLINDQLNKMQDDK
ncbi:CRISPR/Cas system CMR-associated protein Cmr1 (group 7 of RAMP superfamily) [Clostridium tetanomorphum]|uniref:DUF5320 domain-containing protein n=1 Tax=Clostridium tetanomorphum TaxID=1553 RepID=A0A923EDI3_CLOTT|nr:DUF5320 domain-containing protein [Clostridium tetanomorphum]KAJ51651.1 putative cytoplasmic protein [Clostridium tetanomorphum DSM 665]KAJ51931.1 putative cytoplasmic protein [Clostridium tetanomorphum DSM 665]MBC2398660.1 DUF5320 domain-containing protein [Clostridium tetanomorphum]MBP1864060.1 CRISPR/Cas system CMR-associated protein Cmr1 (group 7 of RAMP superfamily) [Clostridium tetanomorphum]NRS84473.1 CRISPR/Cas system CMR-associated protein Cmr1 (group 7 of RAMP superfamily) [Clostr